MRERIVLPKGFWVAGLILLLAFPTHVPSHASGQNLGPQGPAFEAEWLKSGDPCLHTKRWKSWVKENTGLDTPYVKCAPLLVNLTWELEETYRHHSNFGTDRFAFTCQESFPAFLRLDYDQKKREKLDSFLIVGPAPCCPGDVEVAVSRAESTFLICTKWGEKCKSFSTNDPWQHIVVPPKDPFFSFSWSSPESIAHQPANGAVGAPAVGLAKGLIPKPFYNNSKVWQSDTYDVKVKGGEALSWDELKPHLESQEPLRFEIPIKVNTVFDEAAPYIESHNVQGKVTVQIEFGEQEKEEWRVTVLGREKDAIGGVIEYTAQDKTQKSLPVTVEFDWLLEGTFWVKKVKKVSTYTTGKITTFSQTPRIVLGPTDLYDCFLTACQGSQPSAEAGKFVDTFLFGSIEGQAVKVSWPAQAAEACLVCSPKKFLKNKPPYRHSFGSREFINVLNKERISLKDGATVNGTYHDWIDYSISLRRIK